MTRDQALTLIYRHTHRDFKGRSGGARSINALRAGLGTCSIALDSLTDEEIAVRLPYAERKEAERKARRDAAG